MMSDWKSIPLEVAPLEIIDGDRGKNYPSRQDQFEKGHCLFLNAGNVTSVGFNFTNNVFITEERDNLLRQGKLKRNDIVLTTRGTVGNVAYYDKKIPFEHLRINSGMVIIRTNKNELDSRFAYYFLISKLFSNQVQMLRTGSAQPQLPIKDINRIKIPLPPLPTQERIADILGTLDDKIEINRQMNHTLEAMARAIFKSWFVDFDPVYAKMEGRDYPLPAEVMDLFPDELVESELGLIPKGWEVKQINDVVETVGGATPSTKNPDYWENGIHNFATPKDLSGLSSPILITTDRKVTDAGLLKISSRLLNRGTLLMSSRAPVGYLSITDIPVCINQGFIAMKCNRILPNYYMLNWAKQNLDEIINRASGTTFKEISKRNFRLIDIIEPIKEVVNSYYELVKPIYDKITANVRENETLMKIRDTLLPKLISGEVE